MRPRIECKDVARLHNTSSALPPQRDRRYRSDLLRVQTDFFTEVRRDEA